MARDKFGLCDWCAVAGFVTPYPALTGHGGRDALQLCHECRGIYGRARVRGTRLKTRVAQRLYPLGLQGTVIAGRGPGAGDGLLGRRVEVIGHTGRGELLIVPLDPPPGPVAIRADQFASEISTGNGPDPWDDEQWAAHERRQA